jgi:rhodanese-related sulfurtransferase
MAVSAVSAVSAVALLVSACGGAEAVEIPAAPAGTVTKIDSAQGRAIVDAGDALVIDVRSLEEYTDGHLVGAQHIPVEDEALWAERIQPLDRDRPTVVYCRSGRRSEVAAQLLVEAGFTQVYDLGGVQDWDPEDLSVES